MVHSDYTVPIDFDFGADWYFRGLYKVESWRRGLDTDEKLGAFGTWDFFTGLRAQDMSWEINLWVKNAFDKSARTDVEVMKNAPDVALLGSPGSLANATPNVASGYQKVDVINPQTLGATFTYRWF